MLLNWVKGPNKAFVNGKELAYNDNQASIQKKVLFSQTKLIGDGEFQSSELVCNVGNLYNINLNPKNYISGETSIIILEVDVKADRIWCTNNPNSTTFAQYFIVGGSYSYNFGGNSTTFGFLRIQLQEDGLINNISTKGVITFAMKENQYNWAGNYTARYITFSPGSTSGWEVDDEILYIYPYISYSNITIEVTNLQFTVKLVELVI